MSEEPEHELVLPPISDNDNICLPLSINAVAKYWNIDLPISEANEIASKYAGMNGSILIEGINLAERHGLSSLIIHSSIPELKQVIDMGIPPIVILPGLHDVVQHASIISGYDDKEKTIFHYVPEQKPSEEGIQVGVIPEKRFQKLWSEDGCLMILLGSSDILSSLKTDENKTKSNRLCFESERLSIQKQTEETINSLKKAVELFGFSSIAFSSESVVSFVCFCKLSFSDSKHNLFDFVLFSSVFSEERISDEPNRIIKHPSSDQSFSNLFSGITPT